MTHVCPVADVVVHTGQPVKKECAISPLQAAFRRKAADEAAEVGAARKMQAAFRARRAGFKRMALVRARQHERDKNIIAMCWRISFLAKLKLRRRLRPVIVRIVSAKGCVDTRPSTARAFITGGSGGSSSGREKRRW